jgi:DHA1 family multidrug resistance protein-like MFS transporter
MSIDGHEIQVAVPPTAESAVEAAESAGHPRWQVTLYAVWSAQLCAMIGFSFVMPFIPFYIRELGVTDPRWLPIWAGLLVSGSGVAMSLVAPLWGWVADHHGRKLMVQRAMFGGAVILSLMGLARNVYQLFALRVLQGAITGTVPASLALICSVVPQARIGYCLGLVHMAVFSGSSIGPYVGGVVAQRFGYRVPFAVTGSLLFLAGLLVRFGATERFARPKVAHGGGTGSVRQVLVMPGVALLLLMYALLNLSGSFAGPILPLLVEDVMGVPGRAASPTGLILAVSGITSAVAAVTVGRMSDRLGHKRMLVLCTSLSALMCFPQAAARSVWELLAARAVFGLCAGGMVPPMNAIVTTTIPRDSLGRAYGLTTTASSVGWTTGPMLGGLVASALGLRMPFAVMGGLMLAMAAALHLTSVGGQRGKS